MATNAECPKCGVTAADLPYEDLGMTLGEASEFLFDHDGNTVLVSGVRMTAPLAPADLEVLEFERERFKYAGAKAAVIRERFGLTETRYFQRLNRILDDPAALAYDAQHVNRLIRLREARTRNRRTA